MADIGGGVMHLKREGYASPDDLPHATCATSHVCRIPHAKSHKPHVPVVNPCREMTRRLVRLTQEATHSICASFFFHFVFGFFMASFMVFA